MYTFYHALQRKPGLSRWLLAVLLSGMLSACGELPYSNLDNAQLQAMLEQDIPIYDVRRPEEWRQTGVVEGSELLTFVDSGGRVMPGFLEQFSATNDRHEPVILICRTGSRTRTLARYLADEMGYTRVYNVRHGITDWIKQGHPVTRP